MTMLTVLNAAIFGAGTAPYGEGRAWFFVPGSSFEELASQGPVREGQKPKSNGFFGLQPIMHDLL